jgi:hypothetical protein
MVTLKSLLLLTLASIHIQHYTYEGVIDQSGVLVRWNYTNGLLSVVWEDGGDGIFRNSFN